MDPQVFADLREQLSQLSDAISKQTSAMVGMEQSISTTATSIANATNKTAQNTTIRNLNTIELDKTAKATDPLARANQEAAKKLAEESANLRAAAMSTEQAFKSFIQTVISGESGFGKYSDVFKGVGDTALSLGKSFGLLGGIFGGIVKVGTTVVAHMAEQADAIGDATDSIARMGAANAFTMDQVRKMGAGAGLTSFELDKLIKPMESVKGGFVGLGGIQSEGIKRFGELVKVSEDVRNEFRHLGMGDQERNQAIANYVTTMNRSGAAFDGNLRTQKGLQKAALDYTRNLYELADMTGQSVEDEQKAREAQLDTYETALLQNKWAQQTQAAEELKKNGTPEQKKVAEAELKRIADEEAGFDQMNNDMRQAGFSIEQIRTVQRGWVAGTLDETASKFTLMGMPLQDYIEAAKKNRLQKSKFAQDSKEYAQSAINTIGIAGAAASKDVKDATIMGDKGFLQRTTQMADTNYMDQAAQAGRDRGAARNTNDPAQKMRDREVELARIAKLKVDEYEAAHNPFLKGTKVLDKFAEYGKTITTALLALAGAATAVYAGSAISKLFGGGAGAAGGAVKGSFGKRLGKGLLKGGIAAAGIAAAGYGISALASGLFGEDEGEEVIEADGEADPAMLEDFDEGADISAVPEENQVKPEDQANQKLQSINKMIVTESTKLNDITKQLTEASIKKANLDKERELKLIAKFKLNPEVIANNSTAVATYLQTIGDMSQLEGSSVDGLAGAMTSFEGVSDQLYRNMKAFSRLKIDAAQTKNNADAFTLFANAMSSFKGYGDTTDKAAIVAQSSNTFFEYAANFFGTFLYFSMLPIDPKRTKDNSTAFVNFSDAMSTYKGGMKLIDAVSTIVGSKISSLFNQDGPVEAYLKFADEVQKMTVDDKRVELYTTAFLKFSKAMGMLSGGTSTYQMAANVGAAVVGAVVGAAGAVAHAVGDVLGLSNPGPDSKTLDFIGKIESGNSYNKLVGGKIKNDPALTDMTVAQVLQFQDTMRARGHETTALGKYQIIKGTLAGVVKSGAIGLNDRFDAQTQDKAALHLMNMRGREKYKTGKMSTDQYANNLAKEWASLPMPDGRSFYAGQGSNKSLVSRSEFVGALKAKKGGLFSGPMSGYPMELHGTEMVIPQMSPNSLLMKLAKTNEEVANLGAIIDSIESQVSVDALPSSSSSIMTTSTTFLNPQMIATLANKFDSVIDILSESDDLQDKILKHSMV